MFLHTYSSSSALIQAKTNHFSCIDEDEEWALADEEFIDPLLLAFDRETADELYNGKSDRILLHLRF